MADDIPPAAALPSKPPLTAAMLAADDGGSPPAAGGWVPTPKERAIGIGIVTTLGAAAPVFLSQFPGTPGLIAAGVCAALALGISTALGMNSAGPRKLS